MNNVIVIFFVTFSCSLLLLCASCSESHEENISQSRIISKSRRAALERFSGHDALVSPKRKHVSHDAKSSATKLTWVREMDKTLHPEKAMFYHSLENKKVKCDLCPHKCVVENNQSGICKVRKNENGVMYNIAHGKVILSSADSRKHMFMLRPNGNFRGIQVGGIGCQLQCSFCSTAFFSHQNPGHVRAEHVTPKELVGVALKNNFNKIVFTFNETTLNYEYLYGVALLAKKNGIEVEVATSGFINHDPLVKIIPYLSGVHVGLKSFSEKFYKKYTRANLKSILDTLKLLKKHNAQFSIAYLLIPTLNDSEQELFELGKWIKTNLGQYTPIHLLRYYPSHKLTSLPPTPLATIQRAIKTFNRAGLKYVSPILPLSIFSTQEDFNRFKDLTSLKCPYCGEPLYEYRMKDNHPYFVDHTVNERCKKCNHLPPDHPKKQIFQ